MSDGWRGMPGDGGRSFRALIYGDGGPSGWREGDLSGGAIIPSEELRLVAGRIRGRWSRGNVSTRVLKRELRGWGWCATDGLDGVPGTPARPMKVSAFNGRVSTTT